MPDIRSADTDESNTSTPPAGMADQAAWRPANIRR